jgi:MFS transporter, AAHS family, 3-hydroxyphenylpropionic acid transporter
MVPGTEIIPTSDQSGPDRAGSDRAGSDRGESNRAGSDRAVGDRDSNGASPLAVIGAIVILLIYQGYCLSIVGVASPWIAQSFALDPPALARLFAWMSLSAVGTFLLSRLADRVGRRRIILASLLFAPVCSLGAALASQPPLFVLFEILISALLGGSVSSAIVLLAEELPSHQRARGQAFAALASAIGGVLGYILIPFLLDGGYSWRWLLAPAVAGIILVIPVARMLPVESRWSRVTSTTSIKPSRFYDILHPLYRKRAITLLACAALDTMAGTAVNGWMYFESVSVIGLSPQKASTLVVAGMGIGMLGFPLGAWTSERFGRVPTVMYVGGAAWLGALAFYWEPSAVRWPFVFLLVAYAWFKIASGVMTVGANAAATELFPVALRTTIIGCQNITAAIFSMLAQVMIAALIGPLGGLTNVIRYFAFLGIPSAVLFGAFIDETRGVPLEVAAKEEEWAEAREARHFYREDSQGKRVVAVK